MCRGFGILSVLLPDDEPLAPHEEFYHRLLTPSATDAGDFAVAYLKANSRTALYDSVFVPVLATVERDGKSGELEDERHAAMRRATAPPEWKGTFYPEKMPPSQMLSYYAGHFTSTEINYTFRRIPAEMTICEWSDATPAQLSSASKHRSALPILRSCAGALKS